MTGSRRRVCAVVAGLSVLVAACGGDDGDTATLSADTTSTAPLFVEVSEPESPDATGDLDELDEALPTDSTPAPAATSPASVAPSTSAPAAGTSDTGPTECIVGTWAIDDDAYLGAAVRAIDSLGQIQSIEPRGGSFTLTFDDEGTFRGERSGWTFGLETIQGVLVTTVTSTETGTYAISGDQLTIVAGGATPTVTMQLEQAGAVRDVPPDESVVIGADPLSSDAPYTCSGDELTTTIVAPQGGPVAASWTRIG